MGFRVVLRYEGGGYGYRDKEWIEEHDSFYDAQWRLKFLAIEIGVNDFEEGVSMSIKNPYIKKVDS